MGMLNGNLKASLKGMFMADNVRQSGPRICGGQRGTTGDNGGFGGTLECDVEQNVERNVEGHVGWNVE